MKYTRMSKLINIGGFSHIKSVKTGGDFPVTVQTMWKEKLTFKDLEGDCIVKRIEALGAMGCSLIRFAVPDIQSAEILGSLSQMVSMPLAADIHFDKKIALRCLDFPVAKIRINPGNIGGKEKVKEVLEKAGVENIPIRIGVNSGSLPRDIRLMAEEGLSTAEALVMAAQREEAVFLEFGFYNYLISMKASGVADTIEANRILSQRTDAPLHIGVTEAGPLIAGLASSTAALTVLLQEGIGDTIRVSLSDTMENEIIAGREILRAAGELAPSNERLKRAGVKIISCPRCGRHSFDTHGFTNKWMSRLYAVKKDITVAVMGCEVNGPQEALHASLGITGSGDKVLIFKRGKVIKTITAEQADDIFAEELNNL